MEIDFIIKLAKAYTEELWSDFANLFPKVDTDDAILKEIPNDVVNVLVGLLGIEQVISIINNQKQKEIPKFFSYLLVMNKNIKICIESDYDGIGELGRYLCEDWMMACKVDCGLGTWYIKVDNIDIKAIENRRFDQAILDIDKLLQTNYIMARTWYNSNGLRKIGISFNKFKDNWYAMLNYIVNKYGLQKSEIPVIPDDIWTHAKYLSIASDNNSLINWFSEEIPGFGYLVPLEIVKLANGENILRNFMMCINV